MNIVERRGLGALGIIIKWGGGSKRLISVALMSPWDTGKEWKVFLLENALFACAEYFNLILKLNFPARVNGLLGDKPIPQQVPT